MNDVISCMCSIFNGRSRTAFVHQSMISPTLYRGLRAVGPVPYHIARYRKAITRSFRASMSAETDSQAVIAANLTGVTPKTLQTTLIEKLGAQHVDVNDISGRPWLAGEDAEGADFDLMPRWLRSILSSYNRVPSI